jgi:hypothetical protein
MRDKPARPSTATRGGSRLERAKLFHGRLRGADRAKEFTCGNARQTARQVARERAPVPLQDATALRQGRRSLQVGARLEPFQLRLPSVQKRAQLLGLFGGGVKLGYASRPYRPLK